MSTEAFHAAMAELARANDTLAAHIEAVEAASDRPAAGDFAYLAALFDTRTLAVAQALTAAGFGPLPEDLLPTRRSVQ